MPVTRAATGTPKASARRTSVSASGFALPFSILEIWVVVTPDSPLTCSWVMPAAARQPARFRPICTLKSTAGHAARPRPKGP
jgi:hypothetical protein